MTHNITISVTDQDKAMIDERDLKPSQVFRYAMDSIRAGRLEIEDISISSLIEIIANQRHAIAANNAMIKQLEKELKTKT